jgi:hypothetical protein
MEIWLLLMRPKPVSQLAQHDIYQTNTRRRVSYLDCDVYFGAGGRPARPAHIPDPFAGSVHIKCLKALGTSARMVGRD